MAYTPAWYDTHRDHARSSARQILPLIFGWIHPRSIIDIGCGSGEWLAEAKELGVEDILGVDSHQLPQEDLSIPLTTYRHADLNKAFDAGRAFDLALSLEVAEHLPVESAEPFVDQLCHLAPVVLFSAAIPFQQGRSHVNEQWQSYWANLFAHRGFRALDCIRPQVWRMPGVSWWYAQNALLYVRKESLNAFPDLPATREPVDLSHFDLVHPGHYTAVARRLYCNPLAKLYLGIRARLQ